MFKFTKGLMNYPKYSDERIQMQNITPVRTILIVEDEQDIIDILADLLSPFCDKILTAGNGEEALKVIETVPEICAILSDIKMPKMDGLELLRQIRTDFNPVPFVILTACGDTKSYLQAIKLNATDFLEKPFDQNAVITTMQRAIAYGLEISKIERKLEEIYQESGISEERLEEIKRAKRTALAMRIESSLYSK
jgi:CheY-like chemotaxis protein